MSTYLYGAFDSMFLSCQVRIWEWIHTLQLPECQGTPCSKQASYLKIMWLQRDSNPKCGFTLKFVRDMIKTYNQMQRTDKYSQHSSIIWPVWVNGWVFVYELCGCGFKSRCSHIIFRYGAWFEQGVPWHSGNCRVWIHSQTRTWHDKNMQSNAAYRKVLMTQLNHLASLAKWLSVRLRTKWLRVRVPLQSLNLQI